MFSARVPATNRLVFLFKRLFDFDQKTVASLELRLNTRYKPGAGFPLQARMILRGQEWPAKVLNLSGNGLALLVDAAAKAAADDLVQVKLKLGDYRGTFNGSLVHSHPGGKGLQCGIALHFEEFQTQKAFLQVLQPVAIGQSLQPVTDERVVQDEPQFIKRVFRGDDDSVLTVWLEKTMGTPLHSFEFRMRNYFCHADARTGVLEAYARETESTHKGKLSQPVFETSPALYAEIRQLFRWIVPNLSSAVPDDVRAFMQRFAS